MITSDIYTNNQEPTEGSFGNSVLWTLAALGVIIAFGGLVEYFLK